MVIESANLAQTRKKTKHANLVSWRLGASDSIVDVGGAQMTITGSSMAI